ncbi:MAG: DUF1244 domain-containing protein [Alphaproteobacteria bacterium]|nr:DUF1244 domain-containing protein [Alphaproteobacteria bacterium]
MTDNKTHNQMDEKIAARVLARLVEHLRTRTDVQNIDLMNLSGFCRNCLSRWYKEESDQLGQTISADDSKKLIYGMDYDEWKKRYQSDASPEQLKKLKTTHQH